jgi:plastocyanin
MTETVDVMPTGAELQRTDADYSAIAQAQMTRDLATVERVNAAASEDPQDEDGSPTVLVGAGTKRVSNIRFYPSSITIHQGQTITFLKTEDPTEPHTVTFGPEPPNQFLQVLPRGGSTYAGGATEQASSGFLSTARQFAYFHLAETPLPVALTSYRLTFTNTGDFKYICALHDIEGMVGTVHVVP